MTLPPSAYTYLQAMAEANSVIRAWSDYYHNIQPLVILRQRVSLS